MGFSPFWEVFGGFPVLSIFLVFCGILDLEATISTVFAAFQSSNLYIGAPFLAEGPKQRRRQERGIYLELGVGTYSGWFKVYFALV